MQFFFTKFHNGFACLDSRLLFTCQVLKEEVLHELWGARLLEKLENPRALWTFHLKGARQDLKHRLVGPRLESIRHKQASIIWARSFCTLSFFLHENHFVVLTLQSQKVCSGEAREPPTNDDDIFILRRNILQGNGLFNSFDFVLDKNDCGSHRHERHTCLVAQLYQTRKRFSHFQLTN